jgi:hypothetical protein
MSLPRPPLSTLPAAAPPSRLPNPPGIRSLRLPAGLTPEGTLVAGALPGLPPSSPPRISPIPPPGLPAATVPPGGRVSCWDCRRAGNGRHALSANHGTQHAATHRYMGSAAVDRLCTPQGGAASACTPIGSAPNGNRPNRCVIGAKQSRRLPMRRLMSAQGRVSRGSPVQTAMRSKLRA